ncbi:MAG TPA: glycosyltransferase, partial [Dongiaceae bacterium]|nr:glycosyltransferase [Dongiaceae bacterium]
YLKQWQAGAPNRSVIRNASNRGFAAGNNQGLAIARGECVMLLNNDTVVTAGWLEGMFAVLEKNPRTGVVGPMSNYVSGPQLVREVGYRNLAELPGFATRWSREHAGQSFEVPRAVGFCLLATRQVIDSLGGLDEQFGSGNFEDDDFCIRARLAGFSIRIAQAVFIHHTGSQTFKGANIDYRNAMLRNWDLFKAKWQMPADLKLEQGYRMPAAVPEGATLKIALPELAATHRATSKTRWEEGAPVTAAATTTPQPQPKAKPAKVTTITLPACALRGHLGPARECLRQKKLSAAWEAALAALTVRPFHPEAYLLLAEIALAAGAGDVAKVCAEHARRLAPSFKSAKKFLEQRLKGGVKPEWLKLPEALQNSAAPQRLTVCLITKNEEKFLGQCLQSVREVAHQIIVVDTGSTDRTVEIAQEHGAEVQTFAWCDDFSAARNVALEPATGDWVLVLDADEELAPAAAESLRAALRDPAVMAWRLPLVDVGREAEGRSFVPRLFRNAPGLFYVGRVHEQVFSSIEVRRAEWGLENRLGEAQLIHHGYTKEVLRDRNKIERNLRLLEQAIEEFPGEPHLLMNLGLELARSGREAEALARYQEAFAALSAKPAAEVVPELRESLLTQLCTRLTAGRHFAEIARVLTSPLARSGSGLTASLHFSLGLAHLELKQFSEAANQMRQCLAIRQQPGLCPINSDIHTAAPYHCLAMCLLGAGQPEAADEAFAAGLEATGHAATLRMDYARFLAQQNRPVEALQRLNEIIAADTTHVAAWRLGGQIALSRPEFLEFACDWTGEAFRHLPEDLVLAAQRAELLLLSQDSAAADLWQRLSDHDGAPVAVAALILCQVTAGEATNAPESAAEPTVSKAFVQWCQKLAEFKAQETITALAENLETLRAALPTAAGLLQAALTEANSAKAAAVS